MSGLVDELDVNPFFIALQTLYQDKYEKAQEKCFLICIPLTSSIQDVVLTPKFVDYHILQPSPYFQGEYLTTHASAKVSVKYEEGTSVLAVNGAQGADPEGKATIPIVSEELAYNKAYKQFKFLIIERPLDASFKLRNAKPAPCEETAPLPVTASFFECREYLKSSRLCEQAMKELDRSIIQFLNNYIILPNYLGDARARLQEMCSSALEACLKVRGVQKNAQLKECLPWVLESYILGTIHHKLFPVVCQNQAEEDLLLERQSGIAAKMDAAHIGIAPEFSCPMPLAVQELSRLRELQTPREKMLCLKTTVDKVLQSVRDHWLHKEPLHLKQLRQQEAAGPHLASDDLLPMLVSVIAQTSCHHLASNLFFMEQFGSLSNTTDRDDISYCLVTFKAAMEYMKRTDLADMTSEGANGKKVEVGQETQVEERVDRGPALTSVLDQHADPRNPSLVRMRRQLENISLMTKEVSLQEQTAVDPPLLSIFPGAGTAVQSRSSPRNPEERSKELGDFLASLDDDFDVAFGKQT